MLTPTALKTYPTEKFRWTVSPCYSVFENPLFPLKFQINQSSVEQEYVTFKTKAILTTSF